MTTRRINRGKKWILIRLAFICLLIAGTFALVWLRTAVVNLEYKLGELNREKSELLRERKFIIAQRENLYSARNIEAFAVKLGMRFPERENIYYVERIKGVGLYKVSMEQE